MIVSSFAVLAALSLAPGQGGALTLANVRATHGVLGPVRADNKVLPGDKLFVCFDIEGITVNDAGVVRYSIGVEVVDAKGKSLFKQEPSNLEVPVSLGGNRVPGFAHLDVGLEQPPGELTLKATVADRASGKSQSLTYKFEVLPRGFGVVRFTTVYDAEGRTIATVLGSGESVRVQFGVVGFQRDPTGKQPNLSVEMRILDENGKPTIAKPFTGAVNKDVPDQAAAVPLQFLLSLNRPGKFTVEITATDQLGKKTAKLSVPVTVVGTK